MCPGPRNTFCSYFSLCFLFVVEWICFFDTQRHTQLAVKSVKGEWKPFLLMVLSKVYITHLSHPCQHGIGQSQDSLPVDPRKEEAVRWQDGSYVGDDGPIWAFGDGNTINAQFTFPVTLGVPNSHCPADWLVSTGAKHRGGSKDVSIVIKFVLT